MACNNTNYYVGQGKVWMRALGDGCGAATESFFDIGDADSFVISPTTSFVEHYESTSGSRKLALRVQDTQSTEFSLGIKNISAKNLAVFLAGNDSGAVAATTTGSPGNYTETQIPVASAGTVFTEYQGITSVVVTTGGTSATAMTETTDYTVDSRTGGITITAAGWTKIEADDHDSIDVTYDHVGRQFSINALQNLSGDYEIRFNAVNRTEPNTPLIVKVFRANISTADELSLIGSEVMSLNITGAMLEDANGNTFEIEKSNAVA